MGVSVSDLVAAAAATTTTASGINSDLVGVLALGALALIIFAVVYLRDKKLSATFARIFALIVVAVLGVGLGFATISNASRTAAFTLLGTVAGYLAGAKTQTPKSSGNSGDGHGAVPHVAGQEHGNDHAVQTYL
jgi:hypothetical protein